MKTPIIIALSIAGVLGTAGAAMAVNAGTLASFSQTHLGNAPTVLDPTATPTGNPRSDDPTSSATPEPSETAEPGEHSTTAPKSDDDGNEHSTSPSPSPTHTESGDDHGGDDHGGDGSGGHGSDD